MKSQERTSDDPVSRARLTCNLRVFAMLALLIAIPGCTSLGGRSSSGVENAPVRPAAGALPLRAGSSTGTASATSPPRGEREREIREAMSGLLYESGVASVDPEIAPQIVPEPDPSRVESEMAAAGDANSRNALPEVIRCLTRAVIHDPERSDGFAALSHALAIARQTAAARAACRAALDRAHDDILVLSRFAALSQMLGEFEEAEEAWRGVLRADDSHAEARGRLAVLLYYFERYDEAWAVIRDADVREQRVPPQLRALLSEQMREP